MTVSNATEVRLQAPLSVVIPTLNEAQQIGRALDALRWVDEVIVVDGGSTDDTVRIAERAGARVIAVSGTTIGAQRNAGIEAARNEWVLALDADERATPELQQAIEAVVSGDVRTADAYRIRFRNFYLGRELRHGPWGRDAHVRLFRRERRYLLTKVHESLEPIANVAALEGSVLHHPYRDVGHHVAKILKYARWGAEDLRARGRRASVVDLGFRPFWRFLRDYIVYSGWRDGLPGFIAATLSGFAAFLKYAFLITNPPSSTE